MSLFIGLMSGTSMDGVDAALVDVNTNELIAGITCPFTLRAKQGLEAIMTGEYSSLAEISQLNALIGREFAAAAEAVLKKAKVSASEVKGIGSHGQTICHDATAKIPYTWQMGCAHTIAEMTGLVVVADFRTRDLIIGGQGAPFAPIYHQVLFGEYSPLALVNIGGISNITYLLDDGSVVGHDVGPGNCLMDAWVKEHLNQGFDRGGAWAKTGRVIEPLLQTLLDDAYFHQLPPKSVGKEYFSNAWLRNFLNKDDAPNDVQATLLALTAKAIANEVSRAPHQIGRLAVCGGGVHNERLMAVIASLLPSCDVVSTASLHVDPDYIEAMMFAWFASKTLAQTPLDLSPFTGSGKKAIYGAIYAAGIDNRNSIEV